MKHLIIAATLTLTACSNLASAPPQPSATARITRECLASGFFKLADGTLATLVPAAAIPVALLNAGVDRVCADPARFASAEAWLIAQLKAVHS